MKLVGARAAADVAGLDPLPGRVNYFLGNDPAQWRTGIPTYARVHYRDVYPGVDLVYYGRQRQLEYDLVVAPGADPRAIRLAFEGVERLDLDARGDLLLATASGRLVLHAPAVYQEINGTRVAVPARFTLLRDRCPVRGSAIAQLQVGVHVAAYDAQRPLVIDPVLSYATYLGSGDYAYGTAIAVDAAGNAYVTGHTHSITFPTVNAAQATYGGSGDAFVAKLDPTGTALLYSTYLGGDGEDHTRGIAVDAAGNAYVTGDTYSTNFPTVNALLPALAGANDAFAPSLPSSIPRAWRASSILVVTSADHFIGTPWYCRCPRTTDRSHVPASGIGGGASTRVTSAALPGRAFAERLWADRLTPQPSSAVCRASLTNLSRSPATSARAASARAGRVTRRPGMDTVTARSANPESGRPEEERMRVAAERVSFIVRLSRDEGGRLSGIVERVRTGEKERFYGIDAIGPVIARMAGEERPPVPERGQREPS